MLRELARHGGGGVSEPRRRASPQRRRGTGRRAV